jgi:hypothetical protein
LQLVLRHRLLAPVCHASVAKVHTFVCRPPIGRIVGTNATVVLIDWCMIRTTVERSMAPLFDINVTNWSSLVEFGLNRL